MNEPTEAQIKEFWEWCGLIKIKRGWKFPNGDALIDCGNPPIDLNNLFRYAVPKLDKYRLEVDWSKIERHFAYAEIGEKSGTVWNDDPALALFWAIWAVISGNFN